MSNHLFEDHVVDAVIKYLKNYKYTIIDFSHATETGDDIIAVSPNNQKKVFVEAKGATSSKSGSKRFGKPFTRGQVTTHISVSLYRAIDMKLNRNWEQVLSGIALPNNEHHLNIIRKIEPSLESLEIELFLVSNDLSVERRGYWKNFP